MNNISPKLKYYILGITLVLIITGIIVNFGVFTEYLGWVHGKFLALKWEEIIPAKVLELK